MPALYALAKIPFPLYFFGPEIKALCMRFNRLTHADHHSLMFPVISGRLHLHPQREEALIVPPPPAVVV